MAIVEPQESMLTPARIAGIKFLAVSEEPRSLKSVLWWWEIRRPCFNLLVGCTGAVTLALVELASKLMPSGFMPATSFSAYIAAAAAWAFAANACYTLGWMSEIIARKMWGAKAQYLGPILMSLGLPFSVFVTLLPGVAIVMAAAILRFLSR